MVQTYQYPANLGTEDAVIPSWIQFTLFDRKSLGDSPPNTIINLYMPEDITQPSTVSWGQENLGAAGAGLAALRGQATIGEAGSAMGLQAAATIATNQTNKLLGKVKKSFNIDLDLNQAVKVGKVAGGVVTNPYLTAIFEGVGFREFQFRFKFTPHSEFDCVVIDNIVRRFREAALPDQIANGTVFTYPMEIAIECKFDDDKNKWLQSFKRSVITSIDVAYGIGDQWTTFRNGFPTVVVLSLRFKEIQIVVRSDIKEGF